MKCEALLRKPMCRKTRKVTHSDSDFEQYVQIVFLDAIL